MSSTIVPAPVYVVHGSETYLRRQALRGILAARASSSDEFGPTRFDGSTANPADVLDEVRTVSLLGGERTVIVDNADSFVTRHRELLEKYCAAPSPTGCLVLVCDTLDKRFKLSQMLLKKGWTIACEPLRPPEVTRWIGEQARNDYAKSMSGVAAGRLRELCGDSLAMLDTELAKLATYAAERREITVEDVNALVGTAREEMVFAVVDKMVEGNVSAAVSQWRRVVETDRSAVGRAVGGLAFAVRRLLDARVALDRGQAVASRGPWDRTAAQAANISTVALERQMCGLAEVEVAVKTGLSDFDSAIEQFIVKFCQRKDAVSPRR
jgi:DNA polymerase-3 subunit delta